MKTAITSLGCSILMIITLAIVTVIGSTGIRSDELNTAMDTAMIATQRALYNSKNSITNDEEYVAEFSQNLLAQIDSDSDIDIVVYTADYEKGLLDVEVTEKFRYVFDTEEGKTRTYTVRRTSIIDDTEK